MTLSRALSALVAEAVKQVAPGADSAVEPCVPTQNPDHGDYQSNVAFRIAKAMGVSPRAAAEALRDALPASDLLASVEVAGPGFLNLRVQPAGLARAVESLATDRRWGVPQDGAGKVLVIDFSSPNIAKRMHVGHLRSTIIGDALHRLHEACGWQVVADNHIGDWGTQFGKLIVGWQRWRDEDAYDTDAIAELQRLYQKFGVEAEADPSLEDLARQETAKLQAGDPANFALWEQFCSASMREFDGLYERLGVRFDEVMGESAYRHELQRLVEELLSTGVAVESEGAVIVPFTAEDGKGLEKTPLLIRKSDGAALYGTTDLATIRYRARAHGPTKVIYVVDTRQQQHFRQVFAAARKMGFDLDYQHVWFGMLRFPGGTVASTRSGGTINLVDVLDEARDRARAVVEEKDRDNELSPLERSAIAETIGVGAVKYFDLSQNPQSDITFDWDRSLALNGNTAPYLMYAHARCASILRRAGDARIAGIAIEHPLERELALALARLPEVVATATAAYRPNLLAEHLFGITESFGRFYGECRVLGSPEERSRLALTRATASALRFGLDLLGIGAPERM